MLISLWHLVSTSVAIGYRCPPLTLSSVGLIIYICTKWITFSIKQPLHTALLYFSATLVSA